MTRQRLPVAKRAEIAFVQWGPWVAAAVAVAAFACGRLLDPWPAWFVVAFDVAQVTAAVAFALAGADLLRIWGTTRQGRLLVAAILAVWVVAAAAQVASERPVPAAAFIAALSLLALIGIDLFAKQVAAKLPRRPEWEVLHRLSSITALAEPLSQEEAVRRAPEFLGMLEGAQRFRTPGTAEYLDLFAERARFDLGVGPEPADPDALDARWQHLHRVLAQTFAPYRAWMVEPPAEPSSTRKEPVQA